MGASSLTEPREEEPCLSSLSTSCPDGAPAGSQRPPRGHLARLGLGGLWMRQSFDEKSVWKNL